MCEATKQFNAFCDVTFLLESWEMITPFVALQQCPNGERRQLWGRKSQSSLGSLLALRPGVVKLPL